MTTDNEIKQFFMENRPSVSDGSEKFMEELKRQMDLLPTPAKLQRPDEDELRLRYAALKRIEETNRRNDIITVISSVMTAVVVCCAFFALIHYAPESEYQWVNAIKSYSYIPLAVIFTTTILLSFHRSDLYRI